MQLALPRKAWRRLAALSEQLTLSCPLRLPAICVCLCRWHWEVTEAATGNNVLGLQSPQLLMLAPGVQLQTGTEAEFAAEVRKVGLKGGEGPGGAPQLTPAACSLQACPHCPLWQF